jgi:uncharacterized protein YdgA (DUF945 family)
MLASRALPSARVPVLKKSIVFLLLALAVIVLVSPGIVGRLAEQSMDENLDWAAAESREIAITSLGFDRGWFSSEGQHRVEFRQGELRDSLLALANEGGYDELPVLVIDTHIDHGLVPVTSLGREKGSLVPGLGRALSTLSLEFQNGDTIELPGTVYSKVSLAGDLESNLVMEPGSFDVDEESAHWGDVDLAVTMSPNNSVVGIDGSISALSLLSPHTEFSLSEVEITGEQQQTRFGIAVGDIDLSIASIGLPTEFGRSESGPWHFQSSVDLDDDRVSAETFIDLSDIPAGPSGITNISLEASIRDVDGQSAGNLARMVDDFESYGNGDAMMLAATPDLDKLLASGFELDIRRLDLGTPEGTIAIRLDADVAPTDAGRFVMTAALMALDAKLDVTIPGPVFDSLAAIEPQLATAAATGFLRKSGDAYEMQALFEDGLLTINGAPMPITLQSGN